jgi:hypothetical protein
MGEDQRLLEQRLRGGCDGIAYGLSIEGISSGGRSADLAQPIDARAGARVRGGGSSHLWCHQQ